MAENPDDTLAKLQQQYEAAAARLRAESRELAERAQLLGVAVYYDPEDDWFILSIGQPSTAATIEVNDVLNLRYDPATWQIRAIEIPSVHAFMDAYPAEGEYIQTLMQLASVAPGTHVPVSPGKLGEVARGLPQLVSA